MASLNDVRKIIQRALPTSSEETQERIIEQLVISGVDSIDDLKYLQQEDIKDVLPVIQQRKLMEAFKMETESIVLNLELVPSVPVDASVPSSSLVPSVLDDVPISSPSSSTTSSFLFNENEESQGTSQITKKWPENFQVPWKLMPADIQSAIAEGKRASPAGRRQMVRILADKMREYEQNPTRAQCAVICHNIVRQYPKTFADQMSSGQIVGAGYESLLMQIKNRIENVNRVSNFRQHRSSEGKKRGPTDTFGCTRFQPDIPPEETKDTLEEKRKQLLEMYTREGITGGERAEVQELMTTTFALQRQQINALPTPTITELKDKWPYLFTQKGLFNHFELLTDITVLGTLEMALEECGRAIVEFFQRKPTNKNVKEVLKLSPDVQVPFLVMQLLMAHFEEELDGLILLAQEHMTAADIEGTQSLPATPRTHTLHWKVSLEGTIISEGNPANLRTGLATVFSTFYNFNLQYQEEAACTLEFIQRRFIGINPERGSKARRGEIVSKKTGR
ncbi:hypothetical protein WMY93_021489 [Mugilogobius chulae]|uniref:Uncharacterized protein n=1 Tax=Mugilogobius chulae TaxID=88201 RepID=A0AAW0NKZ7_9GOBI